MATDSTPTIYSFSRRALKKARLEVVRGDNISGISLGALAEFFINPSTWAESKTANWVKHNVPGNSDPHQQWTSSGARTITFEALVTNDSENGMVVKDSSQAAVCNPPRVTSVVKRIGAIAAQAFNISGLNLDDVKAINSSSALKLNINEKLNFYRSLCYPNLVSSRNRVESAPFFVKLIVGSTFGKRTQNSLFVVDKVDIQITKQYPDLAPIEARVTFTLTEFVGRILSADTNILTDQ